MLSIDIGSRFLKIVQGNGDKSLRTKKEILTEMPEGCVLYGIVTDFERVAKIIRTALAEEKITEKKAVVTLSSPDIIVKELALPKLKQKETERILANELDEYLSEERYAIDYFTYQNGEDTKALVFGVDKHVVDQYKGMLANAGLTPVALDIHANAVRKLVGAADVIPHSETEVCIITDIGADLFNFHFFVGGELTYTRCMNIDLDIYAKANIAGMRGKKAAELQDDVNYNTYVSLIGDAVQQMLQFKAAGEYKSLGVRIYLTGGGARFDGIAAALGEYLNREIDVLNTKILINALGAQIRV